MLGEKLKRIGLRPKGKADSNDAIASSSLYLVASILYLARSICADRAVEVMSDISMVHNKRLEVDSIDPGHILFICPPISFSSHTPGLSFFASVQTHSADSTRNGRRLCSLSGKSQFLLAPPESLPYELQEYFPSAT